MSSENIQTFLTTHNRPFSLNDILQGLKSDKGKSSIAKSLEKLVAKKLVIEKVYNKQKVYFPAQTNNKSAKELKEELLSIDREIGELTIKVNDQNEKLKKYSGQLNINKGEITLEEGIAKKLQLESENAELKAALEKFNDSQQVSLEEKTRVETAYKKYETAYKKRKRMCLEILNAILDNYPKSKQHLYEDIGIETDENVNFKLD